MVWFFKWSFATAFLIAIMGAAGYYVFIRAVDGGDYVTVPHIVEMPVAQAYAVLIEHKLEMGDQREMYNENVPKDYVIAQRPQAGSNVRAGRKVHTTVSVGPDLEPAPNLVGMTLNEAQADISRIGRFQVGPPFARMPHASPPDTVLAHDPPPGKRTQRNSTIKLLLSSGNTVQSLLMPDLIGMPLEDVTRTLTRLGLLPVPIRTDRPDAPIDRVVKQDPSPGTLTNRGNKVKFWVKTSVPDTWRERHFIYTVPHSWRDQEVRIDVVNKDGQPWTLFPHPQDFVDGRPPRFGSGQEVPVSFLFQDQATVEVYLNGRKTRTYYYEGDADPVVKDHNEDAEGEERA